MQPICLQPLCIKMKRKAILDKYPLCTIMTISHCISPRNATNKHTYHLFFNLHDYIYIYMNVLISKFLLVVMFTLYCLLLRSDIWTHYVSGYHGMPLPKWGDVSGPALPPGRFSLQLRQWAWGAGLSRIQRCEFDGYTTFQKLFLYTFIQQGHIQLIKSER